MIWFLLGRRGRAAGRGGGRSDAVQRQRRVGRRSRRTIGTGSRTPRCYEATPPAQLDRASDFQAVLLKERCSRLKRPGSR